jgi:leucyl aminopeptidase
VRYVTLIQADPMTVAADAVLVPAFQGYAPVLAPVVGVGAADAASGPAAAAAPAVVAAGTVAAEAALGDPEQGSLADTLAALGFEGKAGQVVKLPTAALPGEWAAPVLAVVGLGPAPDATPEPTPLDEILRRAAAAGVRALAGTNTVGLAFGYDQPGQLYAIALGARLGAYQFTEYLRPDKLAPARLLLAVATAGGKPTKEQDAAVNRATSVAHAVRDARDLVNLPAGDLSPLQVADKARAIAKYAGLKVRVIEGKDLAEYGGIIAVGQGSANPPCLVKVQYSPSGAKTHIALVGKGITFDSGGLSIKTATGMSTMKTDMAGAAAALGAIRAAARLGLKVKVTAYLALAENMPSGSATRPGDIITMKDGHTVEVLNTDAEGRLVLADAITEAKADKVDAIVDIATLTGAQIVALGHRVAGVMGTPAERDAIVQAAGVAGEPMWPMPLPEHLKSGLETAVADLANVNLKERSGGMAVAGLFLREFVGETPWAHLDIAGPAFNEGEPYDDVPAGGTGFGVLTLVAYLQSKSA